MYNVVVQTAKEGGVSALWRGVTPTLLGVIPYAGTSFFTYETLKQHYQTLYCSPPPPFPRLAFGAFAGTFAHNTIQLSLACVCVCVCVCVCRSAGTEYQLSSGHSSTSHADRGPGEPRELPHHHTHAQTCPGDRGRAWTVQGSEYELVEGAAGRDHQFQYIRPHS